MNLIIGSHVSFTKDKQLVGSVLDTISYGGNAFMFYTGAPQTTKRSKINDELTKEAYNIMKKNNIKLNNVIVHAPYIINLANNTDQQKHNFYISFLKQEMERCKRLGVDKIIIHPGSHIGMGEEKGIENIIYALNKIVDNDNNDDPIICLETMAGKGTECCYNFEQIKQVLDGIKYNNKVMVCLDTCHLHDAGYNLDDFDKLLIQFDKLIGISKIACIHINDSKNKRGSKKDRHENIGVGEIGFNVILDIVYNKKLKEVPKILETPYVKINDKHFPPYKFEIDMLKNKKINNNLIKDVVNYYEKTK